MGAFSTDGEFSIDRDDPSDPLDVEPRTGGRAAGTGVATDLLLERLAVPELAGTPA